MPLSVQAAVGQPNPTNTLMRLFDFLENISHRSAYLAFLSEYPQALAQLTEIVSQSSWVAAYLNRCPILLDELVSAQLLGTAFDWQALAAAFSDDLKVCSGDTEAQMDTLRRFQHAQVFRFTVQDLAGLWMVGSLSDQLSALADTIPAATLPCAWTDMPKKHRDIPQFAVVGYGKLGGKKLGYASDLDLVYLYDGPHPDVGDVYSHLTRHLTDWFSAATGADDLYEANLYLCPNGDVGFLTHSIAAFEKYQRENAWTWEHQSLIHIRSICSTPEIQTAFDRIRTEILAAERGQTALTNEIIRMREKMFPTHPPVDSSAKYAHGGVVDIEFIVQYLILAHARRYPRLLDNYGSITLLNTTTDCSLIGKALAGQNHTVYRFYYQQQHNTELRGAEETEVTDELLAHYDNVRELWREAFGREVKFG